MDLSKVNKKKKNQKFSKGQIYYLQNVFVLSPQSFAGAKIPHTGDKASLDRCG